MEDLATVLESEEKLYKLNYAKVKVRDDKNKVVKDENGNVIKKVNEDKLWLTIKVKINKNEINLKFVIVKRMEDLSTE
jgi:hypothetical protein